MKVLLQPSVIVTVVVLIILAGIYIKKNIAVKKELNRLRDNHSKLVLYYSILDRWLKMRQLGRTVAEYFYEQNIKAIAIYGYKELGQRLYSELLDSDITVRYIIDKNADNIQADIDVYGNDEELPEVDAIVITATYYYDEIEDELSDHVKYPILNLEDVIML